MEQPCYKCGQTVEEGVAFCPHCSAPQIRVVIAEPAPAQFALAAGPVARDADALPASQTVPVLALPMSWSQAVRPCALAALVAALLMSLGLNVFVAMVSVGFLSVVFYRQGRRDFRLKTMAGAGLGAVAGLFWFAMSTILETLIVIVLHKGPEVRNALVAKIQEATTQTSDPQVLAMLERFKSQGGLEFIMLAGLVVALLVSIVLGGLGGALGSAVFSRRDKS